MGVGELIRDRYEVVQELTGGAQARALLVRDRTTGQQAVLKRFALVGSPDWKTVELFEREAEILKQLSHPQIPRLLDSFTLEGDHGVHFCLVQEHLAGEDLLQRMGHHRYDEAEVQLVARQILLVLRYLHTLRPPVLHRDLKPANVVCRLDGVHCLVDFGAVQASPGATALPTVVGTAGYAPPEQFAGHAVPQSDLYALGATLLHLLSGRSPDTFPVDRMRIDFREVTMSRPMRGLLAALLEPLPEDRLESAQAALEALGAVRSGRRPRRAGSAGAGRVGARWPVAGVALVALLGTGGWWLGRSSDRPTRATAPAPHAAPSSAVDIGKRIDLQPPLPIKDEAVGPFETVHVSLASFKPSDVRLGAAGGFAIVRETPPPGLKHEPAKAFPLRRYGVLEIGAGRRQRFPFILDGGPDVNMALWVDVNQNGDLTDDGPAMQVKGELPPREGPEDRGRVEGKIRVPWRKLLPRAGHDGECEIGLRADRFSLAEFKVTFWASSHLRGAVTIGELPFPAALADLAEGDLDFTNDGIVIDLDRNGVFDTQKEWIRPGEMLRRGGKRYRIEIDGQVPSKISADRNEIAVSVARDGLALASGEGMSMTPNYVNLEPTKPSVVRVEPPRGSGPRHYGVLRLGKEASRPMPMIVDGAPPGQTVFFDRNFNGDLTDDGPATPSRLPPSEGFGAMLELPWRAVSPASQLPGNASLWILINAENWTARQAMYMSRGSLRGRATIAGAKYDVAIWDSRCDLDFTDDGISVDVNRNGRFDPDEYVAEGRTLTVEGQPYRFVVGW